MIYTEQWEIHWHDVCVCAVQWIVYVCTFWLYSPISITTIRNAKQKKWVHFSMCVCVCMWSFCDYTSSKKRISECKHVKSQWPYNNNKKTVYVQRSTCTNTFICIHNLSNNMNAMKATLSGRRQYKEPNKLNIRVPVNYTTIAGYHKSNKSTTHNNCRCFSLLLPDSIFVQRHNINTKNDKFITRRHGIHGIHTVHSKMFENHLSAGALFDRTVASVFFYIFIFIFICTKALILRNSMYTITSMPTCSVFTYAMN